MKDSVKALTVSSVEELDTRSMSLSACPCDLLVTVGSHEQQSISRRAPPPGRHFWSRARMGLWSGVRARIDTASTTVHRSLTAVVRGKSPLFPRVTALSERYTVIDTASKRARTPLHSPIRARDQKCPSGGGARREIDCCSCEPTVTSKSHGHADRLIDLVSSSSTDDTVRVFTESFVLRSSFFLPDPLVVGGVTGSIVPTRPCLNRHPSAWRVKRSIWAPRGAILPLAEAKGPYQKCPSRYPDSSR